MTLNNTFFLLLLLAANYLAVDAAINPEIVENIREEVKSKGETGRLRCTVSNISPSNEVTWYLIRQGTNYEVPISRDAEILVPNDPVDTGTGTEIKKYEIDRMSTNNGGNNLHTFMLVINRLQEADGGDYRCKIETNGVSSANWPDKIGRLTVQVPPQILTSVTTVKAEAQVGEKFFFMCDATGTPKPKITWSRTDGSKLPNGLQKYEGNNYMIEEVKPDDRGMYRCTASNNVKPPAEHDASLIVKYRPHVTAVQDTVGQAENRGFSISLECSVTGDPRPNVEWWYTHRDTSNTVRQRIIRNEKFDMKQTPWHHVLGRDDVMLNTLTIRNVRSNDYTYYFCVAQNELGKNEASIKLFETSECQGSECNTGGGDPGSAPTSHQSPSIYLITFLTLSLAAILTHL